MKTIPTLLALFAFVAAAVAQDDGAKLKLAHEVVVVMRADKMFDAVAAQMKQSVAQAANKPGVTPEERGKVEALQGKVVDLTMEYCKGLTAKMDGIFADVYSGEELTAMKAFYSSPEGQSILTKQAKAMEGVIPLIQQMQRELGPKIQELLNEATAAGQGKPID